VRKASFALLWEQIWESVVGMKAKEDFRTPNASRCASYVISNITLFENAKVEAKTQRRRENKKINL
jgi:hypothetical protein